MFDLIVKSPFSGYEVGTRLTDPELVAEILRGERETSVIKVAPLPAPAAGDAPEPAAEVDPVTEVEPDPAPETGKAKTPRTAKAANA